MSVLLTSAIYIDSVLTAAGTTVSLGYQREQQIVSAGEGTWVSIPTIPTPPASILPFSTGTVAFTVGAGCNYPDIQTAITALGSRITLRSSRTVVTTATNGSPTVTLGTWPTNNSLWIGDLWKPDANSRYYKIKALNATAKTITLWENFADTTISGVSTAWSTFYLDRVTLYVMPGNHNENGASLLPGFDLVGINPYGMTMAETGSTPAYPLANFGDNNLFNIGFAAVPAWGDLDTWVGPINTTLWGGADNFIVGCHVVNADLNGVHSGGGLYYPVQNGGKTTYKGCTLRSSRTPSSRNGGAVAASISNTIVNFDYCRFETFTDYDSPSGELFPSAIMLDAVATYNLTAPVVDMQDRAITSGFGDVAGILCYGANTVNVHGGFVRAVNSSGTTCSGISVTGAATVNLSSMDVEATNTGLSVNNAGATVNIRGGSRFKGGTNSVNNVAGTVNKSTSQPPILIGATGGVITALDT